MSQDQDSSLEKLSCGSVPDQPVLMHVFLYVVDTVVARSVTSGSAVERFVQCVR